MKICQLSTYAQQCGIAEYAHQIHKTFLELGHESRVLANVPYEPVTFEGDPDLVRRVFHVEIRDQKVDFDYGLALEFIRGFDILLVQYESCLYPRAQLHQFLKMARDQNPSMRIAVVFHSSCIWPDFGWNLINWSISHDENVLGCIPSKNKCIVRHGLPDWGDVPPSKARQEMGVPDRFTVGSCGFGRVRFEQTIPAVTSLGWQYYISSQVRESHRIQSIISGLPEDQKGLVYPVFDYCEYDGLGRRLHACDMILLDYHSTTACVTSGAARLAIGAHRKLIVSNTNWFSDLPGFAYRITPDCDSNALRGQLQEAYRVLGGPGPISDIQLGYIQTFCWRSTCERSYIPLFQNILSF